MNVRELAHVMALTEFIMPEPDREVNGGYVGDLLSWVMGRAQAGNAWLTIMSNQNVAAVALMAEVACVVLTEGVVPDETLRQRAEQQNINILGTKLSTFDAASVLKQLLRYREAAACLKRKVPEVSNYISIFTFTPASPPAGTKL